MKNQPSAIQKSLALAAAMALGTSSTAMADWFDLNGTTAGYGVADTGSYDWLAANAWATTFGGTTAGATWVDGNRDAYLIGAGAGTTYTVRLGTGASNVTLRNLAINTNTTGSLGSGNVTIGNVGDTGILTINAANSVGAQGGGTLTVNNPIALNGNTLNFRGGNANFNGVVSGSGNLVLENDFRTFGLSSGTLTLTGANNYTATTDIRSGTLDIGGSGTTGSISSSSALTLSRTGALNLTRSDNFTQAFASTTLNPGAPVLTANAGNTIDLATLTRNTGGTLNLNTAGTIKTKTANTASILGGWATVGGTNWAVSAGDGTTSGAITALGSYTNDTWAAANNTTVTTSSAPTSGSTTNSLRFNAAGANTITLGGINTITSGGILVTSAVGNNLSKITGGTLRGASGKDLVVHQNNTSNDLNIESIVADNTSATGFTKSGSGKVTLTNNNTYTGGTYVNGGTLTLSGTSQTAGSVFINRNAVLELKSGTAFSSASVVTLSGGGTVKLDGATTWGAAADVISLYAGALVDVRTGNFNGGASSNKNYANNFADLNVAAGASFGTSNVNVRFDALSGSGTIDNSSSSTGGSFTFGVGNGSGTFNGVLAASAANKFAYAKNGAGTQELALSTTTASSIGGFSVQGGTVNHTSGSLTMNSSNLMLILSGAVYTLNGGTLRSGVGDANRGVMIGSNGGGGAGTALAPNTFNLQNGTMDLKTGGATQLMVGRAQNSSATGTFNLYNQTGGTATVDTVTIGGYTAQGIETVNNSVTSTFNATGGTFAADKFTYLANGPSDNVTVLLGNTAQITLPAFPLARGSSSTANLTLDFTTGYLAPLAASTSYLQAGTFNNAYLSANGAKFDVAAGKDITIGQVFSNKTGEQGTLTKIGTGNLTLTGANGYTGGTSIRNGKIILGGGNDRLATTGSVVLGDTGTSGVLVLGDGTARNQTLAGLTVTGNGGAVVGGAAADSMLTLDIASGTNTFSGMLGGGGTNENKLALAKIGAGTLTLSGSSNSYTGATTINGGVLNITGSTAAGSAVAVGGAGATGTPTLSGSGTVNGAVTVKSAGLGVVGILDAGDAGASNPAGKMTVNNNLTFETGSIFEWDIKGGASMTDSASGRGVEYDAVDITGVGSSLSITGSVFRVVLNTGGFNAGTFWDGDRTWASSSIFSTGGSLAGFTSLEWYEGTTLKGQSSNLSGRLTDGYFSISGSDLKWTAIPELSNVLIGGLIGAGLLRRRRKA